MKIDAFALQVLLNNICHFGVQKGEHLGQEFHYRYLGSFVSEVLHRFHADQAAADDHRNRLGSLAPASASEDDGAG